MDGHGIASPEEWVVARKTLVQGMNCADACRHSNA
jgi:hypothetical protein